MDTQSLIALAKQIAGQYSLDPALVCAVIEQESSWNTWAIRFEPAFYEHYIQPMNLPPTEAYARSFSWGLMQVMGQTAREMLFRGDLASLCDPQTGIDIGCKVLASKLRMGGENLALGLEHYNGGANPGYAAAVMARMSHYQQASNHDSVQAAAAGE